MLNLLILTIVPIAIFGYVAFFYGKKNWLKINSISDYLYAHSKEKPGLNCKDTACTSIASNFQAASVFIAGSTLGYTYGLIMIWLPVTFAGGIYLLYFLANRLSYENQSKVFETEELPYDRLFPNLSKLQAKTLNILIYLTLIFTAVFELWAGSKLTIESIFMNLPSSTLINTNIYLTLGVAIIMAILFFVYVYYGGYRAVVDTDIIQMYLIWIMLVAVLAGTVFEVVQATNDFNLATMLKGSGIFEENWLVIIAILVGASVLNLLWQLVDPQQWQRAKAAENVQTYLMSLPLTIWGILISWGIPILIGATLAGAGIKTGEGQNFILSYTFLGFQKLMVFLGFPEILSFIFLALGISGIFATALSSADTAVIAFIARIATYLKLKELADVRNRTLFITIFIFTCATGLYVVDPRIENVIFGVFTSQVLFAGMFLTYIRTGGGTAVTTNANLTIWCFVLMTVLALFLNLWPYFTENHPLWGLFYPAFCALIGFLFAHYSMGGKGDCPSS